MLVALPLSVSSSEDAEEVLSDLDGSVNHAQGTVHKFSIPELKVGSLDTLMAQSDELGKLESTCAAVVGKVEDALKNILEGDEDKIRQQKTVNDRQSKPSRYSICRS